MQWCLVQCAEMVCVESHLCWLLPVQVPHCSDSLPAAHRVSPGGLGSMQSSHWVLQGWLAHIPQPPFQQYTTHRLQQSPLLSLPSGHGAGTRSVLGCLQSHMMMHTLSALERQQLLSLILHTGETVGSCSGRILRCGPAVDI